MKNRDCDNSKITKIILTVVVESIHSTYIYARSRWVTWPFWGKNSYKQVNSCWVYKNIILFPLVIKKRDINTIKSRSVRFS